MFCRSDGFISCNCFNEVICCFNICSNTRDEASVLYGRATLSLDQEHNNYIYFFKKVFLIHPIFFFVVYTGKMVNYGDME